METVTVITEEDVAVGALVDTVSGTLPAGKRFLSATVITLTGATEELGINGTQIFNTVITTQLRGMDSTAGQHLIRYAYGEDIEVPSYTEFQALELCVTKACRKNLFTNPFNRCT